MFLQGGIKMKKIVLILGMIATLCIAACSHKESKQQIRVGTIAGPETKLMQVAQKVALKKYGLHVKIITFTDYTMPNQALGDGSIDANAFQHYPFLLAQIRAHGYSFASVGNTFLYPMGLYAKQITSLADLKPGSKIAIPNDPSNEARALLLLEKAGLITLKPNATINATIEDVESNPKDFKLVALSAPQLPRALDDVAVAVINTNYAIPAGLSPSKALFTEQADSPYVNIIVVRAKDRNEKKVRELVAAYESQPVMEEAKKLFGDGAVPGFLVNNGGA